MKFSVQDSGNGIVNRWLPSLESSLPSWFGDDVNVFPVSTGELEQRRRSSTTVADRGWPWQSLALARYECRKVDIVVMFFKRSDELIKIAITKNSVTFGELIQLIVVLRNKEINFCCRKLRLFVQQMIIDYNTTVAPPGEWMNTQYIIYLSLIKSLLQCIYLNYTGWYITDNRPRIWPTYKVTSFHRLLRCFSCLFAAGDCV